jgi:hypothetical protein
MASAVQARSSTQSGSVPASNEASASAVSWGAVIGGAFAAAALSLVLLALGTGIGLSAVSPWTYRGASASMVSVGAIIWLIIVQILASAMGGYLAGRLRTKWVNVHTHEVYFRDSVHGFLVWCVGLVITAAFLASAAASVAGGSAVGMAAATTAGQDNPNAYFVDSLFRSNGPTTDRVDASVRAEVGFILARGVQAGDLSPADRTYLAQLVSARTGLNQAEAQQRVSAVFDETRQAADNARKAVAHSLYWTFLALLIGQFCASYAATFGGRQRDRLTAATI